MELIDSQAALILLEFGDAGPQAFTVIWHIGNTAISDGLEPGR